MKPDVDTYIARQSAFIYITPRADGRVEGPETVMVTLQPGTGYTLSVASAATVTIVDVPSGDG